MTGRADWTGQSEKDYLVWSNEHRAWWGPDFRGYTTRLSGAGCYTRDDALMICASAVNGTADRLGILPELPVALSDVKHMLSVPDGEDYVPGGQSWE